MLHWLLGSWLDLFCFQAPSGCTQPAPRWTCTATGHPNMYPDLIFESILWSTIHSNSCPSLWYGSNMDKQHVNTWAVNMCIYRGISRDIVQVSACMAPQ